MKELNEIYKDDGQFEALLRQYLLVENDTNIIKQQTMNMTAEIVFGSPSMSQPNVLKEREMLEKLYRDLNLGRPTGRKWIIIPALLVLITSIVFYRFYSGIPESRIKSAVEKTTEEKLQANKEIKQHETNQQTSFMPIKPLKSNISPDSANPQKTDAVDSLPKDKKPSVKINPSNDKEMGFTPISWNPDPYIKEYDWSGFDVKWEPELKKYIKKTGQFNDSMENYIKPDLLKISHDYYEGAPFKKTPDDMVYLNYADQLQHVENIKEKYFHTPMASRFYLDTSKTKTEWYWLYNIPEIPESVLSQVLNPFYFRKYEVTNKEYKEFLAWLAKQNGYDDYQKAMKTLEDVQKAFVYHYVNPGNPGLKAVSSENINVFPDTTVIYRDFPFSKTDKMAHDYFRDPGPEFDDRPVCGVNYWQAMAYLDWKTKIYQDYFDNNKIPYKISFQLPSDIEWEMAASLKDKSEKNNLIHYNMVFDDNWITSLVFSINNGTERFHALDHMLNSDVITQGNWILDGYLYPGPADLQKKTRDIKNSPGHLHYNNSGISWMDNNVSEWMRETYQENWLPMFKKHQAFLEKSGKEEDQILKTVETYFDKRNDPDGQLVRGGNFYDERYSDIDQRNLSGIMLKRFVSPSKSYSTIGFRYVVRVEVR